MPENGLRMLEPEMETDTGGGAVNVDVDWREGGPDTAAGWAMLPRNRQWRPWGKGLLPVLPSDATYDHAERFVFDSYCGAPEEIEKKWGVRRTSESHAAAWRILLVMALTGQHLLWDILDAEQDLQPFTERQLRTANQAWRQKHGLGILSIHHLVSRARRERINGVLCTWLRLNERGRNLLKDVGVEPVESDWDRMDSYHDPQERQLGHTLHCLMAARLARGRGWEAVLMPEEQPQVDLRLTPPGDGEPIYVECEARAPQRVIRRWRKWARLRAAQDYAYVIARNPRALADLCREIGLVHRIAHAGTDLETLIIDPAAGWFQIDNRPPPPRHLGLLVMAAHRTDPRNRVRVQLAAALEAGFAELCRGFDQVVRKGGPEPR